MSFRIMFDMKAAKYATLTQTVRDQIVSAINEEVAKRGLTKRELADKMDINASVLTRQLSSRMNLTLRSIATYAWALERDIVFQLVPPEDDAPLSLYPSEFKNTPVLEAPESGNIVMTYKGEARLAAPSERHNSDQVEACA